jgi:hypothetical protein
MADLVSCILSEICEKVKKYYIRNIAGSLMIGNLVKVKCGGGGGGNRFYLLFFSSSNLEGFLRPT